MNPTRCLTFLIGLSLAITSFAKESYKIAVVPMGTTHQYWKLIHAGAQKAEAEFQAEGLDVKII